MKLPETETLDLELDAGVLHLTLNRPECKNAMNRQMLLERLADQRPCANQQQRTAKAGAQTPLYHLGCLHAGRSFSRLIFVW